MTQWSSYVWLSKMAILESGSCLPHLSYMSDNWKGINVFSLKNGLVFIVQYVQYSNIKITQVSVTKLCQSKFPKMTYVSKSYEREDSTNKQNIFSFNCCDNHRIMIGTLLTEKLRLNIFFRLTNSNKMGSLFQTGTVKFSYHYPNIARAYRNYADFIQLNFWNRYLLVQDWSLMIPLITLSNTSLFESCFGLCSFTNFLFVSVFYWITSISR